MQRENEMQGPPCGPATLPADPAAGHPPQRGKRVNWLRLWIQVGLAMLAFNIVAGFVTWYFLFPRLHPAQP